MNNLNLGYIAGLLDSDGSIQMCNAGRKEKRINRSISISQNNNLTVLIDIKNTLGVGKIYQPPSSVSQKKYSWTVIKKEEILKVCDLLIPYCIIKRSQLEIMKEACSLKFGSWHNPEYNITKEKNNILIQRLKQEHNNNETIDFSITPEYSWLAGMVDGDGCLTFSVSSQNNRFVFFRNISLVIMNLKLAQKIANFTHGTIRKDSYYNKDTPLISVNIKTRRYVSDLLEKIIPFLQIKKEKALIMLTSLNTRPSEEHDFGWNHVKLYKYSDKDIEYLLSLYNKFKNIKI